MKKIGSLALFVGLSCFAATFLPMFAKAQTIDKGIYIEGTDMAGKTHAEAESFVRDKVKTAEESVITLTSLTDYNIEVSAKDLGISWSNSDMLEEAFDYGMEGNIVERYKAKKDLEIRPVNLKIEYAFDYDGILNLINENMDNITQEMVNFEFHKEASGFSMTEGQKGITVNPEDAASYICIYLENDWDGNSASVNIPSVVDEPEGGSEDLAKIKDVIGTFTTAYKASGVARVTNVKNGCRLVNGTTLYPGEQFSMLDHIAPFTKENGYEPAGSYMNGLLVDSLGGGICQVSSTLYNAVLLAELQVDVRSPHSMIVDYVKPSGDAAIAESSGKDFKFTNNKDFPIYIEGYCTEDKTITFNIYGVETRPDNRVISFRSEVLETIYPDTENIIQDAGQPLGYRSITPAHIGYKARYIKEVTVDGVLQSSEPINNSTYKMVPRTIVVGVSTTNTDAYNQMQEAIASGSVDQCKGVADYWASQAVAPAE